MKRREFITLLGGAVAWPLAAGAQQAEPVRRVGFLGFSEESRSSDMLKAVRDELQKLGWTEGRNLRLDVRFGGGDVARTRAYAAELVRLAPDVIFTPSGVAFAAVQQETRTIPIVFFAGDVADGRVKNIAHPEGNATGFAGAFSSLGGKWLELLKEAAPNVTRVAYLVSPNNPYGPSVEAAARALSVQLFTIDVRDVAGMRAAIESFAAEPNGGLILQRSGLGAGTRILPIG